MNIMRIISLTILTSDMKCIDSHLIYNSQSKENQTKPNQFQKTYVSLSQYLLLSHGQKLSTSSPPDRIHMIPSEKCIKESYEVLEQPLEVLGEVLGWKEHMVVLGIAGRALE